MTSYALCFFFFFNDPAPTEIYPLPLHAALPIKGRDGATFHHARYPHATQQLAGGSGRQARHEGRARSEEHTSELQSRSDIVCRLLLEKKKKKHRLPRTRIRDSLRRERDRTTEST